VIILCWLLLGFESNEKVREVLNLDLVVEVILVAGIYQNWNWSGLQ
jgi:hypothetical protein